MKRTAGRNWGVWAVLLAASVVVALTLQVTRSPQKDLSYTELAEMVRAGKVEQIEVSGDESRAVVTARDGTSYVVLKERGNDPFWVQAGLTAKEIGAVDYGVRKSSGIGDLMPLISTVIPFALMLGFLVFMMRQAQSGNNQAMSFGRSRARLMTGDTPTVTFQDVAGVEEAKQELAEVVEFLQEPEKFVALGAEIPRGVLMVGPPGCGKTLMARAVAGEAGVPFFTISGSEFVEMFVGVGASRVRDLFEQAKKNSPCIVFIDEIDAVGRQRGAGLGGSHDEREQTLNQVLVEMDGFDTDTNVIVMAATNRPDILDPALLRPGRFDRRVVVDRPDTAGRKAILGIHMEGKPIGEDVDVEVVAKGTPGFSGADLENLVNEAAILAARRDARRIGKEDFEEATDKVMFGPERKSRVTPLKDLEVVAYHEAGHAVVSHYLPNADPIHKVTIVPRGMSAGMVSYLPKDDRYLYSKSKFKTDLAEALGGRAAEELVFGEVSTGAANDLEVVTRTARDMVTRYGMSEVLGPLTFGDRHELVFLGRDLNETRNYSEDVARQIDGEVRRFVNEGYDRAKEILADHLERLHAVAKKLLEVETLDRLEFEAVLASTEATAA